MSHLLFYLVEAALLSAVAWVGLALAINGLRRLGAPFRMHGVQTLLVLWVLLTIVDLIFSERFGPEFVTSYHICFALAIGGAALWVFARVGRRGLAAE